ncbi:MAG TPA: UDP-N-acetylmuramyl-tripeptide synthetase [Pseudogracilibacillus sp.]|nr:UDP-N-acetylmuramyl-tripeptide synthetase [Pseudogracilibacillus sp.]
MNLKKLLSQINIIHTTHDVDKIDIHALAYDSRKVGKNDLFVAIRGYVTDGHLFLQSAANNGAQAAIVEEIDESVNIPQIQVDNSRLALAIIADQFYRHPSRQMQTIGVTATNGKTTTSYMINEVLENAHFKTGVVGSVNVKVGNHYEPAELTTPESLDLQAYFHEMQEAQVTHAIMEVSSAAQELYRVAAIHYDIVTLNNINKEHIDTHGSFENYVAQKTKLIKQAPKDSIAILNLDCQEAKDLRSETDAHVITFALDNKHADFTVENLDLSTGRAQFDVQLNKEIKLNGNTLKPMTFRMELGVPGLHSVSNSMIAIIIGLINDIAIESIQTSLKAFNGVHRRFQFIHEGDFTVIDDHFANPGNINVTLETLSLMDYRHLKLLYAIRGNRGAEVNEDNANTLVKWAPRLGLKEVYVTRSQSDVTDKDKVTDEEYEAFVTILHDHGIQTIDFDELDDSIQAIIKEVGTDDLLLLAGCQGMDEGAKYLHQYV